MCQCRGPSSIASELCNCVVDGDLGNRGNNHAQMVNQGDPTRDCKTFYSM
jgi:hypothetical protein